MPNLMQLVNKSKVIENKSKICIEETIETLNKEKITSNQKRMYTIFSNLKKFYNSLNRPNMIKRYADGGPDSEHYNKTIKEISNDLNTMIDETNNIASTLDQMYNQIEIDRQQLSNRLNFIDKKINKLKFSILNNEIGNTFIESFVSMKYIDKSACILPPVYIDTNFGYISLDLQKSRQLNNMAHIKIVDDSNGFPGNTHQVNVINNEIKFIGEQGLHLNLKDILDNNSDTWFEYELYKISDEDLFKALNLGFEYEEGASWITNDNVLKLNLKIYFKEPTLLNCLTMSPFIAPDKDAIPCIINDIVIFDGKGGYNNVINNIMPFDKEKAFTFSKQYCKEILISFIQEIPYNTSIGHMYYKELNNKNIDYFKILNETKFNIRTNGPNPKIENLGILYNDEKQYYIQPTDEFIVNEDIIKNNLFKLHDTNNNTKSYMEQFNAFRFHIGIRDINLYNQKYCSESEYISKNFTSNTPIKEISIKTDDYIPDNFFDYDEKTDWIEYYFSIDNGKTWNALVPVGEHKNKGFYEYLINSGTPAELRKKDTGYIETANDVYDFKIKIILKRPLNIPDADYYSPYVYEYTVQIN